MLGLLIFYTASVLITLFLVRAILKKEPEITMEDLMIAISCSFVPIFNLFISIFLIYHVYDIDKFFEKDATALAKKIFHL